MKNHAEKEVWFRAKRYGWGWYPIRWQGWVVILIYVVALLKSGLYFNAWTHSGSDFLINFSIPFIILTILLLIVCYTKGEYPHWSWGNSKKDSHK